MNIKKIKQLPSDFTKSEKMFYITKTFFHFHIEIIFEFINLHFFEINQMLMVV